ncbi:ABC transporter substrate-binding protein [Streptomyces pinistramenti]|uniref:ABC transporter substrate-binding protein n=1 Tax=Streptomyces pinistramenti TaxID=2884812 RepID=UPI001D0602FE|nr:ABC transporter substrate-binding protein [Streptomyces pinistramenti]MCB5911406.1 ABC transporter substrate-binding protein [Streptomyces pinistramenti]
MPRRTAALLPVLALALTGCGAQVAHDDTPAKAAGYPVTVKNCGKPLTFDKAPSRVVTNDVNIADLMFALGLEDHMAGYVMPTYKGDLGKVAWRDAYDKVPWLSKKAITKEIALDAKADLVFAGWSYGFGEGNDLTPASLKKLGIGAYVLTESCRNGGSGSSRGVMPPLEALYTDLANLGKIFHVEDRATKLIKNYRKQIADVRAKLPEDGHRPSVFLYDSGQDKPMTSGAFAAPDDIITKAGGDNLTKDVKDSWTTVGWETVVERDPDVIVINDYGTPTAPQKKKFLKSYPPLANVSAVKHDRIFVLDYADLVESPRNPAAVTALARYLRTVHAD